MLFDIPPPPPPTHLVVIAHSDDTHTHNTHTHTPATSRTGEKIWKGSRSLELTCFPAVPGAPSCQRTPPLHRGLVGKRSPRLLPGQTSEQRAAGQQHETGDAAAGIRRGRLNGSFVAHFAPNLPRHVCFSGVRTRAPASVSRGLDCNAASCCVE